MLVDAHLDLAYNARRGRDLTLSLAQLRAQDPVKGETATLTFEELRRAEVGLCFGTLFALPQTPEYPGYATWQGARAEALAQLDQYRRWQDAGHLRLLLGRAEVLEHAQTYDPASSPLGVVLLMEGADPLRDVDDLPFWVEAGVRAIGLAWGKTRYAGGTAAPGPLSDRGRELLSGMREMGVIQDVSHLDEEAFFEAVNLHRCVMASHSNSRHVAAGNRHLSDEMAKAVAERGGVVGLVLLSKFLLPSSQEGARATLSDVQRQAEHYAAVLGEAHIGLGSDLDGGFGNEKTPQGIDRYSDIAQLAGVLAPDILGANWLRFLTEQWT